MHTSMPNQQKLVKTNWAVGVVNSLTVSCIAWMSARACSLPSALKRVTHDIRRDSSSATVSTICVSTRDTRLGDTRCTCKIKTFTKLYCHISSKTAAHKNHNLNNSYYNKFYTANEFVIKSFCYTMNYIPTLSLFHKG